jgi:hypothetical protein
MAQLAEKMPVGKGASEVRPRNVKLTPYSDIYLVCPRKLSYTFLLECNQP